MDSGSWVGILKTKRTFTEAPIVQYFNPAKPIMFEKDASRLAIAGILMQYDIVCFLRPVIFYSQKCSPAEQNYITYDREHLAIVETLKQWQHNLQGANDKVIILWNYKNLEYLQTSKVLASRQGRWSDILSTYSCVVEHLEGTKNLADGLM